MIPITFSKQVGYRAYMKLAFQISFNSLTVWVIYITCLVLIFISLTDNDVKRNIATPLTIALIILMLLIPLRIYGRANKRYKSTPNAGEESFWIIDENGIQVRNSLSSTKISWNAVIKITQNNHWIFIWYGNAQYSYIPRSAITEIELKEIKRLFFVNRKNPTK